MTNKVLTPQSDLEVRLECLRLAMQAGPDQSVDPNTGVRSSMGTRGITEVARRFYGFVMYDPQGDEGEDAADT